MLGNMFLWLVAKLKQGVIYFIKQACGNEIMPSVYQKSQPNSSNFSLQNFLAIQPEMKKRLFSQSKSKFAVHEFVDLFSRGYLFKKHPVLWISVFVMDR